MDKKNILVDGDGAPYILLSVSYRDNGIHKNYDLRNKTKEEILNFVDGLKVTYDRKNGDNNQNGRQGKKTKFSDLREERFYLKECKCRTVYYKKGRIRDQVAFFSCVLVIIMTAGLALIVLLWFIGKIYNDSLSQQEQFCKNFRNSYSETEGANISDDLIDKAISERKACDAASNNGFGFRARLEFERDVGHGEDRGTITYTKDVEIDEITVVREKKNIRCYENISLRGKNLVQVQGILNDISGNPELRFSCRENYSYSCKIIKKNDFYSQITNGQCPDVGRAVNLDSASQSFGLNVS